MALGVLEDSQENLKVGRAVLNEPDRWEFATDDPKFDDSEIRKACARHNPSAFSTYELQWCMSQNRRLHAELPVASCTKAIMLVRSSAKGSIGSELRTGSILLIATEKSYSLSHLVFLTVVKSGLNSGQWSDIFGGDGDGDDEMWARNLIARVHIPLSFIPSSSYLLDNISKAPKGIGSLELAEWQLQNYHFQAIYRDKLNLI